jgi:hypothetical protein
MSSKLVLALTVGAISVGSALSAAAASPCYVCVGSRYAKVAHVKPGDPVEGRFGARGLSDRVSAVALNPQPLPPKELGVRR